MNSSKGTSWVLACAILAALACGAGEVRSLFNGKDLSGWYTYLKGRGKNVDPKGVFSVSNGVLRITGEEWGSLITEEEFADYRLTVEYRFDGTRFPSKAAKALDSGILFHSTGPDGGFAGIWMASHEYNLIQGASGDIWGVHPKGSAMSLAGMVDGREKVISGNARLPRFDIDPTWTDRADAPLAWNEKPVGEWNTAVLECRGDVASCFFNGTLVNRAHALTPAKGRVQLQSEGCGIEFRKVTIESLEGDRLMVSSEEKSSVASPATVWAQEELDKYARRIFGRAPKVRFLLPGDTTAFADDFAAVKGNDGYAVRRDGDTLVFIADNPRGHVNGVHRWLERNSDIIWPRPAGDVAVVTPRPGTAFAVLDCDYRDIPAFKLRYAGGTQGGWQFRRYLARNASTVMINAASLSDEARRQARQIGAIDAFFDIFGAGHDMETRWFPVREFYVAHPEFWALVDGERKPLVDKVHGGSQSQFCESNPAFAEAFADSVEAKIRNLPKTIGAISINIEDSVKTCQCEDCNKPLALPNGTTLDPKDPAYKSTRFFLFFNKVARRVAKLRPDLKILQYAYVHLSIPPKIPVERNIVLKFCPYPRNMRESIFEGPSNETWRRRAEGWLANTPSLYWREYYFCQCVYFPRPICDTAAIDLREIRRRGVTFVYTDAAGYLDTPSVTNRISIYSIRQPYSEHYDMVGAEFWAMQKLFWNPDLDPEALRAEFCRRTFGPAADDVIAFYRLIREAWYSESMPSAYNDEAYPTAANFIAAKGIGEKCRMCLASAAAKADTPFRKAWLASMRGILDRWLAEAPKHLVPPLDVPQLESGVEPGFDFEADVWSNAATFPTLCALRHSETPDATGNRVKIFSDEKNFIVGFDVKTPGGALYNRDPVPPRNCPVGDHAEVMFSSPVDGYYHFIFDPQGRRYDAKGRDAGWKGAWEVRTEKTPTGWKAVVKVPFETIGFNPHLRADVRFLPCVAVYGMKNGASKFYSWNGAVPHEVQGWGMVRRMKNEE